MAGLLSGGVRTRLAVARMLLRSSNTLLMDEPTNHLDLDSKDVLLDALEDYGGTLIIVSHDRYFVERLATKIVAVGDGGGAMSRHPTTPSATVTVQGHRICRAALGRFRSESRRRVARLSGLVETGLRIRSRT